jgi:all-trans-8'-apo-beta-carotenal 15,15'-oxygenase
MQDHAPYIERAFARVPPEQSYAVEEVEGAVPAFVRGSYYLNGPARFARGGRAYRHWLDGDGMVCALRFEGGRVHFTNRFVRGAKFAAEEEAGRPVFRAFGTAFKDEGAGGRSDRLKRGIMLESPLNVSVYPYRGALLAFGEQGLPCALDPVTLETRGEFNFGGCLNDISPFAAHPKFDPFTGEMFNFGVAFAPAGPHLNLYRFGSDGRLIYRRRLPLPYPCSVHDFGLSRSYAVFYLSPYVLDMEALAREGRTLMDSLRWDPAGGSRLLVAARETGEAVASVGVGARYCLHFINCFEEGGRLNVDVIELDRPVYDQYQTVPDLFTDVCEGRPVRLVIDVGGRELIRTEEIDYCLAPDFPSVDPRRAARAYEDFWMLGISATGRAGRKFFDQLVHARWGGGGAVYQAPPLHYLGGEPVFVPGPGREGAVICQLFDAPGVRSAFAVFDAFDVGAGPVATLRLREPIHLGFHAAFRPEARPHPPAEETRTWRRPPTKSSPSRPRSRRRAAPGV